MKAMTGIQTTTKTGHYFRVLAVLALAASLLAGLGSPAHADGEFIIKVNSTADLADASINGRCAADSAVGDQCTLRAAIQESNATPETEIIAFDIPGSGVQTISPTSQLPPITRQAIINGYSQPGASFNTLTVGNNAVLKVELDGSKASGGALIRGLTVRESSDSLIRGLVINRFSGEGISTFGDISSGPTIANNNRIEGNFIGTDPSGTQDLGNSIDGVTIASGAFNTTVGGTSRSARNLISGNGLSGVRVSSGSAGNQVQGNYIGTDKSGKADLGNAGSGVLTFDASNNTIGGATAGAGNVISGNGQSGVALLGSQNRVLGNRIGTNSSGTGPLGNTGAGVSLGFVSGTFVGDGTKGGSNTIAFNGGDGIVVGGSGLSTGNRILINSIFSNKELGIDLVGGFEDVSGVTANEPGDVDTGPNGLQNLPVITSARTVSRTTTIKGKLNSAPHQTYTLQFFSNPKGNEGKKFIGQKRVSTDDVGKVTFTFRPQKPTRVKNTVTATATRSATGDTSEFSSPRKVVS